MFSSLNQFLWLTLISCQQIRPKGSDTWTISQLSYYLCFRKDFTIEKIIVHEKYNLAACTNDIALIKLKEKVIYVQKTYSYRRKDFRVYVQGLSFKLPQTLINSLVLQFIFVAQSSYNFTFVDDNTLQHTTQKYYFKFNIPIINYHSHYFKMPHTYQLSK